VDDQVTVESTEDELQRAVYILNNTAIKYNSKIKDKGNGCERKDECEKTVVNNNIIEQVHSFVYVGYTIVVKNNRGLEIKMNRFNQMYSTIRRTLNNKTRKDTQKKFYKAMALSTLTFASKIWTITKKQEPKLKLQK
jgi:hypothetical protein